MKVWDCVTFHDELVHLRCRVQVLYGRVHSHLVVEGTHTHQGEVRYTARPSGPPLPIPGGIAWGCADLDSYTEPWDRERAQRDFLGPWLTHIADPDDLVFITDVDEHINPEIIDHAAKATLDGPVSIGMRLFYYGLEWEDPELESGVPRWLHPRALRVRDIPESLSTLREEPQDRVLYGGGWHISYAGDVERRLRKLTEFAHIECNDDEHEWRMRNGPEMGIGPNGETLRSVADLSGIPEVLVRRFGGGG